MTAEFQNLRMGKQIFKIMTKIFFFHLSLYHFCEFFHSLQLCLLIGAWLSGVWGFVGLFFVLLLSHPPPLIQGKQRSLIQVEMECQGLPRCLVSGAILLKPTQHQYVEFLPAAQSQQRMLAQMLAFPQTFSSAWNCQVTSKCISILTNTSSKKGFFSFSHTSVPDTGSVCPGQYLASQLGSLAVGSGFITQSPPALTQCPRSQLGSLAVKTGSESSHFFSSFGEGGQKWMHSYSQQTSALCNYKRVSLFVQG